MTEKSPICVARVKMALVPRNAEAEIAFAAVPENKPFHVKLAFPRSPDHHRLFFAVIAQAFDHASEVWLDDKEIGCPESLRAYLLCKAGYRETMTIEIEHTDPVILADQISALMRAIGHKHVFIRVHKDRVVAFWPRSIRWSELDQAGFKQIADRVFDVVAGDMGLAIEALRIKAGA